MRFSQNLQCGECGAVLAAPGTYSTLTSEDGALVLFNDADPPTQLQIILKCRNGHRITPPEGSAIEPWFLTPEGTSKAPVQAVVLKGKTASGQPLDFTSEEPSQTSS